MKVFRCVILSALITYFITGVKETQASWYAGGERQIPVNGVTALISTPQVYLDLIDLPFSGVSNWVTTVYADANGTDWLQAGWHYYWWESIPWQFVEWCIDCSGTQGTYEMHDTFATQDWGTTVDYWVIRDAGSRWCAYTAGLLRYCVDNLHSSSMNVQVLSEVHTSTANPLDTTFDQVRYKDPIDNYWKLFDAQVSWVAYYPYDVEVFNNYYFHTYRMATEDIYLPIILR
jgi:hypothetical protein